MTRTVMVLLLALNMSAIAGDTLDGNADGYVDILVPIVIRGSVPAVGAYGSAWSTEVWLHNGSNVPLAWAQRALECPLPISCDPEHPSGSTKQIDTVAGPPNFGAMYAIESEIAEQVTISARLLELSRRAQPNGIELPVVWEHEFRTEPIRLVAIPRRDESRAMLRIYDVRRSGLAFLVTLSDASGSVIAQTTVTSVDPQEASDPWLPFVAVIPDLTETFPQVRALDRYDVAIAPAGPAADYWAFVSVTDRETQHVMIVSPDR